EKKKFNLVALKVPELPTEDETKANDRRLAEAVCKKVGVPEVALARVFRHGLPRADKRARPLKICFSDNAIPGHVLQSLRVNKQFSEVLPPHSRLRRDLTLTEQRDEADAFRRCYEANSAAQASVYYVNDRFELVKSKNPRKWVRDDVPMDTRQPTQSSE
ncbi:MAG: hypothetical protein RR413_10980, partial [Christensenellaceae bacterium]